MAVLREVDAASIIGGQDKVLVVAETISGQLEGTAAELICAAKSFSNGAGDFVGVVICTADQGEKFAEELVAQGADRVYLVEDSAFGDHDDAVAAEAINNVIAIAKPDIVLAGATRWGRAVMPRVAVKAKTGLSADTTEIQVNTEGILEGTKPAFGEHILAVIVCPDARPQMTTVRPRIYRPNPVDHLRDGELVKIPFACNTDCGRVKLLDVLAKDSAGVDIENAEVIIGLGRGIGGKENIALAEQLAELLSAEIGVTRPLVDEGYYGHDRQIGQTGKVVRPRLYIALGISGALQHTVGIAHAEAIVAVNKDANAPIFKMAHYGIVGDVSEVIPKLIKSIKGN